MVRTYETLFITLPTLTEDEERQTVDSFAEIVGDAGGIMAARERMGRRRLAYPIKKFEDGVYNRFLYDAEPAVSRELDRKLKLNDRVLRHMTIFMEPEWATFSKEQAIRDAEARAQAEADREAGLDAADGERNPDDDDRPRRRDAEGDGDDDENKGGDED